MLFILDSTDLVFFDLGIPSQNRCTDNYGGCLVTSPLTRQWCKYHGIFYLAEPYPSTVGEYESLPCIPKVISLCDIVSADGTKTVSPILKGQQMMDRRSSLAWLVQQTPTKSDWALWSSSISSLCVGTTLIRPISLQPIQGHQIWFCYMDVHRTLFHNDEQTWQSIPPSTFNFMNYKVTCWFISILLSVTM